MLHKVTAHIIPEAMWKPEDKCGNTGYKQCSNGINFLVRLTLQL